MKCRGYLLCLMLLSLIGGTMITRAGSSSLQLMVGSDHRVYSMGEAIGLTISLKNVGDRKLSLFHPSLFGESWRDWELTVRVTNPRQREMVIRPRTVTARRPWPEESHFQVLAPGEAIGVRLFFPGKDSERTNGDRQWVARLPITDFDAERLPENWLRWKYRLKGDFALTGDGRGDGQEYLELYEIIRDVFSVPGRYNLEFDYMNRCDYFLVPDAQDKYLGPKKVTDAWAGALSQTITLEIGQSNKSS